MRIKCNATPSACPARGAAPAARQPQCNATISSAPGRSLTKHVSRGLSLPQTDAFFDFTIGNSLNVSLGPLIPPNKAVFDAGTLKLGQAIGNVDVSHRFKVGRMAGPLNVAFGGEVRREQYEIVAGEPDSYRNGGVANRAGGIAAIGAQVLTSILGLDLTVDYYHIAIDDRIVLSGNFTGPQITALLVPFGARFFTNAINTRTNGVDLSAGYRIALEDAGDLRLHASYNNTRTKIVGTVTTPPQLAGFDQVLFDRIERRRIECYQPRDSFRTGADWRRSRWGAVASVARYGEFCTATANPAGDQLYSPKWLTHAEVSYRIARTLTLAAGVQNIFNVFPDRNTTVNSFNGIQTFPSQSPFGMNGRAVYGRIAWTL